MAEPTTGTAAATGPGGAFAEAAIRAAAEGRGEPGWLVEQRLEAARAYAATPMPTPKLRPWKYTDVTGLALDAYPAADAAGWTTVEATVPAGGYAGSLAGALDDDAHAEMVRAHLGTLVRATEGKFPAMNAALWSGGVFVHAPRGGRFEQPVGVHVDASPGAQQAFLPRLLIVAEPASEVTIHVRSRSNETALLAVPVIEVVAGADAIVRLVLDERWGGATQEFATLRSRVGRGAHVQVASLAIGGALVKQTLESLVEGEGGQSTIRGAALGAGDQHFDFVTLQDHIGPHTQSDVQIKSALAGASKSVYYGVTRVEETAAGANAQQENRNLLLSGHAKADSDPVLEILTSDVIRCGHGATVGPVDRDALFYLQSRGLHERQALQLIVAGFFHSVLADMNVEGLDEELESAVHAKLETAEL